MPRPIDEVQRLGLKLFLADPSSLEPRALVPVFHRWIQTNAVDQLLIDVADYTHLPEGPCVLLVAHEGNVALDGTGGRLGLQYVRKQPLDGSLPERLTRLYRLLLDAAILLEADPVLRGAVRFRGDELEVVANDRLLAPNDEASFGALREALGPLLERLYPGGGYTLTRETDARERLTVAIAATGQAPALTTLRERLQE